MFFLSFQIIYASCHWDRWCNYRPKQSALQASRPCLCLQTRQVVQNTLHNGTYIPKPFDFAPPTFPGCGVRTKHLFPPTYCRVYSRTPFHTLGWKTTSNTGLLPVPMYISRFELEVYRVPTARVSLVYARYKPASVMVT